VFNLYVCVPASSEIADFTPSAHAQSVFPGHAFRKR